MRIPLYRTQAAPTGEAPGRSIRARMSMEPFVQEAMSRGNIAGEALKQVGEFARMRYELATQEKLDNALLRAEEELRTTARDMEGRNMVGNVLDGENPLWNQSVTDMRGRLQAELGKDRRANAIFNERFGQMELTQRFSLRGAIDAKLERQAAAAREQRLTQAENEIANGTDIANDRTWSDRVARLWRGPGWQAASADASSADTARAGRPPSGGRPRRSTSSRWRRPTAGVRDCNPGARPRRVT